MVECFGDLVFVTYQDHVLFNRSLALAIKPQVREAVGWLVYEGDYYITISWDRDAEPPTLKGGDPKASGLVLLKADIVELKKLQVNELPLQKNSEYHLNCQEGLVNNRVGASSRRSEKLKKRDAPK